VSEVNERKYTLVTVFFEDEYELLLLQARSMRIYASAEIIEKILIIDNSERPPPKGWKARILSEYGRLSGLVEIVGSHDIARLPWANGWKTQQILKLMASHIVATERYLILDSKNHLVFPLTREALEASDGRPRTHFHSYFDHPLRRHLERALDYYGLERAQHVAHFTATATPFVIYTEIARKMIVDLSNREGRRFELAFTKCKLTEFFAYTCFVINDRRDLAALYDFHQPATPCIWEHTATRSGCQETVAQALAQRSPFFALHRSAIAKLDADARKVVAGFWFARSLFETSERADTFLAELQLKSRKKSWSRPLWRALKAFDSLWGSHPKPPAPYRVA
jgi:Family of unknown function (DUF6492)